MTCDAFHRAYFAPPIANMMAAFQKGFHFNMLAMVNLQLPPHLARNVYPNAEYARLAAVLDPWLDEYGVNRLTRLFECVEEMHAIMLLHATYSGRVDVVEVALKHCGVTRAMMMLMIDVAAWKNQRHVLDFFQQHPHASGWTCSPFALVAAAREGHLDIVRFLNDQFPNVPSTEDAMDMAAEFGHLDVVRYLHEHRSKGCTTRAMNKAAKNGHLEVLCFLHTHRSEGCTEQAMELACEHGRLDVVQWLVEHRRKDGITEKAFDLAAGSNHMAVVEFLHGLQALSTEKAMDLAAGKGHLSMVQWLHQHRPLQGCTEKALNDATSNGHLVVVEWLHENRREGGTSAGFCGAAGAGHLDVLKWVVANRPDMVCTRTALEAAVGQDRVDVVEWLLNREHPEPGKVWVKPCIRGSVDCVKLLRQHHSQLRVVCHFLCVVRGGDLNVIKWMVDEGEYNASALDVAASYGHLDVVQWLHARSFPATTDAMDNACENGHLHVARWLHRCRGEGCTENAMAGAIQNGHFSVVRWLRRHRIIDITHVFMEEITMSGDLTLVEYLHMHHLDDSTMFYIAPDGGHFSVVQFLHSHRPGAVTSYDLEPVVTCGHVELAKWFVAAYDVTITSTILRAAVESGDLTMLKWVLSHWEGDLEAWLAAVAANRGQLADMRLLKESGCDWTVASMESAAAGGRLAVLVALQAHGVECPSNAMVRAAGGGHVQVVRWLHTNGYNACAASAIEEAARMGHVAMVAYLHNEICPATSKTLLVAAKHDAVHVVKWLVAHGVFCSIEVMAWAEQRPSNTSGKWLLAYQAGHDGSSGPAGPKRRKVSKER